MNVNIRQDVLLTALEKGAAASISEEAGSDIDNVSRLMQSVHLTFKKKMLVESNTEMLASKYFIAVKKENGIEVGEDGSVLVPAKEMIRWVRAQGVDSTIKMTFSELANPQSVDLIDGVSEDGGIDIKKIGSLKLVSKNSENKTNSKWELDCYDSQDHKPVNFNGYKESEKLFDINVKQLKEILSKISIASLKKDYQHVLDSVAIQVYKNHLYFASTDGKRCALYKIKKDEIVDLQSNRAMLIPFSLLNQTIAISDEDNILSFYYDEKIDKVFIAQSDLETRLTVPEKDSVSQFPNIKTLLDKEYTLLTKIKRASLSNVLITSSIVNESSALFSFDKDNKLLTVTAKSEDGKLKPTTTKAKTDDVSVDLKTVWGVRHLLDVTTKLQSKEIHLFIPDNKNSVKVVDENDKNFSYFAMKIQNSKYETK